MNINVNLTDVIGTVATFVLGWLFTTISTWVHAKGTSVKQTNTNVKLDKYIDLVEKVIDEAVQAMNSTVVDSLKAAAADGKLTTDEGKAILGDVLNNIIKVLSPEVQVALSEVYGDLPTWITIKIENAVESSKTTTDTTVVTNTDN